MKLKKVVSLALAGVMAVSMLAGCGTSGKKDEPTQDDNGTVKAGYSAEFEKIADIDLDYVAFQDSTVDQDALKAAVASCTDVQLYAALVGGNLDASISDGVVGGSGWLQGAMPISSMTGLNCVNVFTDKADLDCYAWTKNGNAFPWYFANENDNENMTDTLKAGAMFAVDGSMDTESVLTLVEKLLGNTLTSGYLSESGKQGGINVDYKYTVSVSLVNRVASSSTLMTADMDFVAVTITRTGTVADA